MRGHHFFALEHPFDGSGRRVEARCRKYSWVVWTTHCLQICFGFSFIALPFLINGNLYMACLLLLVVADLVAHGNPLQLVRAPALLVAGSRDSMFGIGKPAATGLCKRCLSFLARALLLGAVLMSTSQRFD
eukprot:s701_g20.t1